MAHLADEWAEQRQQCVDVLCAYLRLPWAGNPTQLEPNTTTTEHSWPDGEGQRKCEREVRQTLVRVIASHLRSDTGSITGPASAGRTWISTSQTRPCQTPTFVKPTSAAGPHTDGRPSGPASFGGVQFSAVAFFDDAQFSGGASFGVSLQGAGMMKFAVQTAGNVGSELLIFVLGAAQSIEAIPDDRRN